MEKNKNSSFKHGCHLPGWPSICQIRFIKIHLGKAQLNMSSSLSISLVPNLLSHFVFFCYLCQFKRNILAILST